MTSCPSSGDFISIGPTFLVQPGGFWGRIVLWPGVVSMTIVWGLLGSTSFLSCRLPKFIMRTVIRTGIPKRAAMKSM